MQTLQFQTKVDCLDCLKHLALYLNSSSSIEDWELQTRLPITILTIHSKQLSLKDVTALLKQAGVQAHLMNH